MSKAHVIDTLERTSILKINELARMSMASMGADKPHANAKGGIMNRGTRSRKNHQRTNITRNPEKSAKFNRLVFSRQFFITEKREIMTHTVIIVAKAAPTPEPGL